jgi:hypothetical protein
VNTRRQFLIRAPIGLLGVAAACRGETPGGGGARRATTATPSAPVVRHRPLGPEVTAATFAEAEKLARVTHSPAERQMMADSWRRTLAATMERRTGPRAIALPPELSPAMTWNPVQATGAAVPTRDRFVRSAGDPGALPASDPDIAFAPVTSLSRWIEWRSSVAAPDEIYPPALPSDPTLRSSSPHADARARRRGRPTPRSPAAIADRCTAFRMG